MRTGRERVVAVHQYLWLDDRRQALFLTDGCVARQGMRIGCNRRRRRDVRALAWPC